MESSKNIERRVIQTAIKLACEKDLFKSNTMSCSSANAEIYDKILAIMHSLPECKKTYKNTNYMRRRISSRYKYAKDKAEKKGKQFPTPPASPSLEAINSGTDSKTKSLPTQSPFTNIIQHFKKEPSLELTLNELQTDTQTPEAGILSNDVIHNHDPSIRDGREESDAHINNTSKEAAPDCFEIMVPLPPSCSHSCSGKMNSTNVTELQHQIHKQAVNKMYLFKNPESKDEHAIFGEYIASELRSLGGDRAKYLKRKLSRAFIDLMDEVSEMELPTKN